MDSRRQRYQGRNLVGKWISADGGTGYDFKDDFSIIITSVGEKPSQLTTSLRVAKVLAKLQISESGGKVTWDYKITNDTLDLTTPDGRARKLKKTTYNLATSKAPDSVHESGASACKG